MAHIQHRPGRRRPWQVRYRDPTGRERARSFLRKSDADRFSVIVEADKLRGEWTDPRLSKTTVAEWSDRWLRTKAHLKPKTLVGYKSNLRAHVLPTFGGFELRHVDRMAVEEWVADLQASGLGHSGVRQARQVLNSMLKLAVEAGYLVANPVTGVKVARQADPEMLFLSAEEVERLALEIREPYATLVYLLAYGGLRWGETAALRRKRCQLLRSRIEVAESLSEAQGKILFGSTKTYRTRMIVVPNFLRDLLAEHLAHRVDEHPDALVFTSLQGQPLRNSNFRRQVWYKAVAGAGLPDGLRIHDLRHTCASLLIAQGAHPKAIQVHLGHSSISVTMDRYGHLFPSDSEALATALDAVRSQALADQMRTKCGPDVVALTAE
ncbi:MAG: tyrosine-type recombinase/integrase [Gammaproteobacteria bacterium]|nr:tyrosine-type recombinase/integrase [Gammaproteobacteria bacterium]